MGLAAVDEALDRIRSGQPVLVAGVDTLHAGVAVWPAAPAPGPLVEACVAVHTLTDTSDPGGVLAAAGPAAVAADLLRLAGHPAGAWAEVALTDGPAPAHSVLARLADDLDLALVDRADLVHHRWSTESLVVPVADSALPTRWGGFRCVAYRSHVDGVEHLAVVHGDPAALVGAGGAPMVRIHSECLTGDVFGSRRCDCGEQLDEALDTIVGAGAGVVVYLRGHEGRGIGLADKVAAYALQDRGLDTVDANLELGHEADRRHYGAAAQILRDLGVTSVRLLTNNPAKVAELEALGVGVAERLPLLVTPNPHNRHYLETKRRRLGHLSD